MHFDRFNYRRRGNMLAMVALLGTIIMAILLTGFLLQFLFLNHQKKKSDTDECALTLAQLTNERDRIGQMNTVVERSRELVYQSRTAHQALIGDESDPALEDFSRLLVEEARAGAQLVESSRQMLCDQVVQDLRREAKNYRDKLTAKAEAKVGYMTVSPAILGAVEIGVPIGVSTNVTATEAFDELLKSDRQNRYVSRSGLAFAGDVNAKLPPPDNDLDFELTPLASPVGAGMAPPRLTAKNIFDSRAVLTSDKEQKIQVLQIPTAVFVKMEVPITVQGFPGLQNKMQVGSSAAAGGALTPPDEIDLSR